MVMQRHKIITIDITYACNLKCINCNRSCRQAPSNEHMSIEKINRFIEESIDNNAKWEKIWIQGGEPTLHPDIFKILQLLLGYKKNYSPHTKIEIFSNAYGEKVNDILAQIPKEINIRDDAFKKSEIQPQFCDFNIAPRDLIHYKFADYSWGCWITYGCGIGLTPFGYYPCGVAGGIDRVFGFDLGKKKLPPHDDWIADQLKVFCQYCGYFREFKEGVLHSSTPEKIKKEIMSPTWKKAYAQYRIKKPSLSLY